MQTTQIERLYSKTGGSVMICDICNINEATIHVQELKNGKKKTLNICPHCASEHSLAEKEINGFNLAEILYNISSQMMKNNGEGAGGPAILNPDFSSENLTHLKCKCGWDTVKFRETGRLGCPECYNIFASLLRDALKSMHKGTYHMGKQPGSVIDTNGQVATKILSLQKELEGAVQKEDYEKAAELRDLINALRSDAGKNKKTKKIAPKKANPKSDTKKKSS